MMLWSEKEKLQKKYYKWLKKIHKEERDIEDCPINFMSFAENNGFSLIKTDMLNKQVYWKWDNNRIIKGIVKTITICDLGVSFQVKFPKATLPFSQNNLGKTLFLTEEEAKKHIIYHKNN